jgi:hypothetical protein
MDEYLIVVKNGKPYPEGYPQVVRSYDEPDAEPGSYISCDPGPIQRVGKLGAGFSVRPPKNANERRVVEAARSSVEASRERYSLKRWAQRDGATVEWGNVVAGMSGQSFRETFATEAEAIERERQARAGEAIGADREPKATARQELHG